MVFLVKGLGCGRIFKSLGSSLSISARSTTVRIGSQQQQAFKKWFLGHAFMWFGCFKGKRRFFGFLEV
jgi:hypothetical protein